MTVRNPIVISAGRKRELDADDVLAFDSTFGEHEVVEIDWTAQANKTFTNGESGVSYGGMKFNAYIPGSGGSIDITNGVGLVISAPTTLEASLYCPGGADGLQGLLDLDNDRWERGGWAIMCQYTYNYPTNTTFGYLGLDGTYPYHGCTIRRDRNQEGAPNTTSGGITTTYWWNNAAYYQYGGTTTDDIMCIHCINPFSFNTYTGTYSGGWPKIDAMTSRACVRMGINGPQVMRTYYKPFSSIVWAQGIGGNGSSMTFLRSRIILVNA